MKWLMFKSIFLILFSFVQITSALARSNRISVYAAYFRSLDSNGHYTKIDMLDKVQGVCANKPNCDFNPFALYGGDPDLGLRKSFKVLYYCEQDIREQSFWRSEISSDSQASLTCANAGTSPASESIPNITIDKAKYHGWNVISRTQRDCGLYSLQYPHFLGCEVVPTQMFEPDLARVVGKTFSVTYRCGRNGKPKTVKISAVHPNAAVDLPCDIAELPGLPPELFKGIRILSAKYNSSEVTSLSQTLCDNSLFADGKNVNCFITPSETVVENGAWEKDSGFTVRYQCGNSGIITTVTKSPVKPGVRQLLRCPKE